MSKVSVLVVEDNLLVGAGLKEILEKDGYAVTTVEDGKTAEAAMADGAFKVVILDMMLPDGDGRELLKKWEDRKGTMAVIIITAYGDVPTAVECLKAGAYDFLTKPVQPPILQKAVGNAVEHLSMKEKVTVLQELSKRESFVDGPNEVTSLSPTMTKTMDMAEMISQSDFSCLFITGESGTGKGLLARTIHKHGLRRDKPFVEVNCSALPDTLVESELFGHKKGSFTDAKSDKVGLFELADGGTLFLDEIGDMPVNLQAKLLKVIEEQTFRRLGSVEDIHVNVAIIAATNQDIKGLVAAGKMRDDLYYRLNVIPLEVPPLRDRMEDIEPLCEHFRVYFTRKFGRETITISDEAMSAMTSYTWPGNVRELRNTIERGCILTRSGEIENHHLLFPEAYTKNDKTSSSDQKITIPPMPLDEAERLLITAAMEEADGNKNKTAKILGIHRTTLYKKLIEYGMNTDS